MPKDTSVYPRKDSPYWWIAYYCPRRMKRVSGEKTPFRREDPGSHRKALALAVEKAQAAASAKQEGGASWESWVVAWLRLKHRQSPLTLQNYLTRWRHIGEYLDQEKLYTPRHVAPDFGEKYIAWRMAQTRPASGKSPCYNTCLMELALLARVVREAIRRGFADHNPVERLGLQKDDPDEKPEITDDEIKLIREALVFRPEWMQVSFEIAIHQGCRLKETQIPLERIDLTSTPPRVQFHAKGKKVFTTQLHPDLVPMFKRFKAERRPVSCKHPAMAAKEWHFFFKEIELPHLCFHCTRVTVVTRMARAGVPVQQAMAYVGHANTLIHKIYQRLKPADVGPAILALQIPAAASSGPSEAIAG